MNYSQLCQRLYPDGAWLDVGREAGTLMVAVQGTEREVAGIELERRRVAERVNRWRPSTPS
jgi:hypothetical protein